MSRRFNVLSLFIFFFNDTATTEIYPLSLHDALPIYPDERRAGKARGAVGHGPGRDAGGGGALREGRLPGPLSRCGLEAVRLADVRSGLSPRDIRDGDGPVGLRVAIDDAAHGLAAPRAARPQDLPDVLLGLGMRGNAAVVVHGLLPRVVRRQGERHVARIPVEEITEV